MLYYACSKLLRITMAIMYKEEENRVSRAPEIQTSSIETRALLNYELPWVLKHHSN